MFDKFLVVAQRGPGFDAHIGPQSWFLPKNESNVRIFKAEDGERPVQDFLCAMLECFNRKRGIGESNETDSLAPSNCPRIPLSVLRDRRDPTYRLPQYDISLDMLSLDTIKRITAIFKKDFCRFGYRTKRGVDPIVCDDETTSTASTTATSITTTTTDAATPTMMGYTIGPSMTSAAGDLVSQDASLRINSWTGMGVGGPP